MDPENKEQIPESQGEVDSTPSELEIAKAEAADWRDKYLRKLAEFDNFRKRSRQELSGLRDLLSEDLIVSLLPVVDDFDRLIARKQYATRSEAIRDLIRDNLVGQQLDENKETVGTITMLYDHHVRALTEKLTDIQHRFQPLILSGMHVHLDHDHCLEVLVVRGKGRDIKKVADILIGTKGVKHGKFTMSTTGKGLS